ncbi:MAG: hypothetical protein RXP91_06505, partial [Nitrososphaeria archaeon]
DVRVELGKLNVVVGPQRQREERPPGGAPLRARGGAAAELAALSLRPLGGYANIVHMCDASRNVEFAVEGSAPNGVPFHYRFVVNGAGDALKILEEELTVGDPGAGGVRLRRRADIVEVHCSEAAIEPLRQHERYEKRKLPEYAYELNLDSLRELRSFRKFLECLGCGRRRSF